MKFRTRRDRWNQLHLEAEETDANSRTYWRDHGIFETQDDAEEYAEGIKANADVQAQYDADVAAGRDIISTFEL